MIITSLWDIRGVRSERVLWSLDNTADLHALTKEPRSTFVNRAVDTKPTIASRWMNRLGSVLAVYCQVVGFNT